MRPLGWRITFEVVLGAVLIASLVIILRLSRRIAEYQRHQEADAQALRLLQEAWRQKDLQKALPGAAEEAPAGNDHAGIAKREAVIERLDRELAESRSTITNLQTQLSAANDQNAKAQASADERWQKQQADAQAQLEDLQKKLDAAQAESDIARQRVAALEADNAKLKTDSAADTTRANEVAHAISSLQDLDRRRDVYLTSILRRYRDITSEFHAMSSMLDTSHDPSSSACSDAVLSRIQNAVNSAEDDLRQLNELNDRSQKLEKQLLKK
jgi:chromosome segregation ATPase